MYKDKLVIMAFAVGAFSWTNAREIYNICKATRHLRKLKRR